MSGVAPYAPLAAQQDGNAPLLRRLYDFTLAHAAGPRAEPWFAGISFVDGAVFPIPPELLQIPMAISRPSHAFRVALIGMASSTAGALLGYAIGAFFYAQLAVPLLELTGHLQQFETFLHAVGQNWLLWPIAFCLTPQLAAMAAGSVPLGIAATVGGSLVGRGSRFLIIAWLLKHHGTRAALLIDRYFHQFAVVAVLLVAAFVVVKYAL